MSNAEGSPKTADTRGRIGREVALVFGASALLTATIVQVGTLIPFVGENALALVAIVFLYVPVVALRRRGLDPGEFGLDRRHLLRGLRTGLVVTGITLIPFFLGFHAWETVVLGQRLEPSVDNYLAFPESLRVAPTSTEMDGLYVWRQQRNLIVRWVGEGPWRLELTCDCELIHRGGPRPERTLDRDVTQWDIVTTDGDHDLILWARGGRHLRIAALRDGQPLEGASVWLGRKPEDADGSSPIELRRGLWWIPLSLLVQFLLVGLPEEFFYRGYLQARIDSVLHRRWRWGPLHTSPAIIVTSGLFALGHFLVGFDPQRLAVFFPSLAFGWIRDRTGGLGGCILFHAACNLMIEFTAVHYWPT